MFAGLSLRSSLSLSILLAVFLTLLAGAGLTYLNAVQKVEEEMAAAVVVGARVAGNAVDDPEEWRNPRESLVHLVADFHGDRHLRARWIDLDGRQVMSSMPAAPSAKVPHWFRALITLPQQRVEVVLPEAFEGLGRLYLEPDPLNEVDEVWRDSLNTLTILSLLSMLVVAVVNLLLVLALRPLDRLVAAFDTMGQSVEPPSVPETGPRDLVKVYRGFNHMAGRLAASEARNRKLDEQLQRVQEEERADIARDLHDEIGPFLFSADVEASAIDRLIDQGEADKVREHVRSIRDAIRHMQSQVRDLLGRLRTDALVDIGLSDAIDNLIEFWRKRFPDIAFEVAVLDEGFGAERDAVIYRVVQEAVSNAIRHGKPGRVLVEVMEIEHGVSIRVANDGRPIDAKGQRKGLGLTGMRERVEAMGGRLVVENSGFEAPEEAVGGLAENLHSDVVGEEPLGARVGGHGRGVLVQALLPLSDDVKSAEDEPAGLVGRTARADCTGGLAGRTGGAGCSGS